MAWAASQADIDGMARLTFTVGETGVLVTGEQSAVSAYTAQLGNLARMWGQPVTVSEVADVGAAAAAVTSFAASSGSYVQLSQRSMELLRQHQMIPGQTAKFFQGAVRGAQGRLPTGQVADAGAQERARQLRNLLDSGQIGLMLQLLVLAEDSYYQWQRLRLERVRVIETDHLAGVIARANEQLAADLRRDSEMVGLLQARLATYAAQRPLERLPPLAARDLQATMTSLRHDIEAFARRPPRAGIELVGSDATNPQGRHARAERPHGGYRTARDYTGVGGSEGDRRHSNRCGSGVAGGASALGQEVRTRAASLARRKLQRPAITPTIRSSARRGSE
jgi:hypothetical protein